MFNPHVPNLAAQSQAKQFRAKAVECLQQADLAKHPETRAALRTLAVNYEKLATHAESVNRQATLQRRKKPT